MTKGWLSSWGPAKVPHGVLVAQGLQAGGMPRKRQSVLKGWACPVLSQQASRLLLTRAAGVGTGRMSTSRWYSSGRALASLLNHAWCHPSGPSALRAGMETASQSQPCLPQFLLPYPSHSSSAASGPWFCCWLKADGHALAAPPKSQEEARLMVDR